MTAPAAPAVEPLRSVDQLVELLHRSAHRADSGEGPERVGILDHGLQCAAVLTRTRPHDIELQIAGLVHDLGHVAVPGDPDGHGRHGHTLFAELLGGRVASLVELHVPAKRYLVATDPNYLAKLSDGSIYTLGEQGGPMAPDEMAAFEREPHKDDALVLRRADEAAKVPGRDVPGLDEWMPRIEALVAVRSHLRR